MKTTIHIWWIHCASCTTLIEQWLYGVAGVNAVTVNMATNTASVDYDEHTVDLETIHTTIHDLGYTVTEQSDDQEVANYLHKFLRSTLCTLPVGSMMFIHRGTILNDMFWIDTLFIVVSVINVLLLWRGFHVGFVKKAKQGKTNMDTLISIGTLTALIYSVYAYIQTYTFGNPMDMGHFVMGANFIITFILLGKYLETKSKGQASQAIQKLMQLQEKEAIVLRDGKETRVPIDEIALDDIVVVRAGDKIPVDGVISKGQSDIDEAMLTGESMPVAKHSDDEVYTGTIVINGNLQIRVTKTPDQTMLAKIIEVVNDAQAQKPPIQKLVDTISSYFVWGILVIAVITFIVWYTLTGDVSKAMLTMISTIVIACPCAMGLATPVAIMVASGKGASQGVLIKSGETLEKSKTIDVVVFDKTGTLTEGKPQVTDLIAVDWKESSILAVATALSKNSHHPLSQAVVQYSEELSKSPKELTLKNFTELSGQGLKAVDGDNNKPVLLGNKKLLKNEGISIDKAIKKNVTALQEQGKTVNFVVEWTKILGLVALLDTPKADAPSAIAWLEQLWIAVVMISGDTKKTVAAIAERLGITKRYAEVMPDEKAQIVQYLQNEGKKVAFVGDGINDAPALAQSDLAIGIGQWSDIAIETAEVVLVHWSPQKVLDSIKLARKTYAIIKQNLFWAFAYNTILVPVAAFGLLVPMYASLAMSLSSVSVVLNSLRIKH